MNPPASVLLARLKEERGGRCQDCGSRRKKLQFAHLKPTPLSGRGRGSRHRYYDIKRHPDYYALLCRVCHMARDFAGQDPWTPGASVPRIGGRTHPLPSPDEQVA